VPNESGNLEIATQSVVQTQIYTWTSVFYPAFNSDTTNDQIDQSRLLDLVSRVQGISFPPDC
jgi:hypothetical protein